MMSFSSLSFILLVFPCFLLFYQWIPSSLRKGYLVCFSLLFYGWLQPSSILVLILLTLVNYVLVKYMGQLSNQARKREFIFLVVVNLFSLFYVKYYGFLLTEWKTIFPNFTFSLAKTAPLGISFYVFSLLSYVIDVYRYQIPVETNFLDFSLYVAFFPKLLMGPIIRYMDFKKQLHFSRIQKENLEKGMRLFVCGLFSKVVLANTFAVIWAIPEKMETAWMAWLACLGFTLEIYFDFQGYTQMAQGIACCIGIHLPDNFHQPYRATSIRDFWHRWHMSLSTWFRDYVYIPLGGNRTSKGLQIRNLMIVWLCTGIWHGANWTFVVWGLYYGILLIVEKRIIGKYLKQWPHWLQNSLTMILVMIGWVLFASPSMSAAKTYLLAMVTNFHFGQSFLIVFKHYWWLFALGILLSRYDLSTWMHSIKQKGKYPLLSWGLMIGLWIMIFMYSAATTMHAFIYANF